MSPKGIKFTQKTEETTITKKDRIKLVRRPIKSSKGEFIWELKISYELSQKLSEQIPIASKESLLREYHLKEG